MRVRVLDGGWDGMGGRVLWAVVGRGISQWEVCAKVRCYEVESEEEGGMDVRCSLLYWRRRVYGSAVAWHGIVIIFVTAEIGA